jgi:amino acid adenylation domain-containing protein
MRPYLLHRLLERRADEDGDLLAVVDGEREVTYEWLDERANRLAALLMTVGVSPGDRVGLLLDKSLEAVIAVYGTLKAGAVYVPLDASSPPTRLASTASNAGMNVVLTSVAMAPRCREVVAHGAPLTDLVVMDGEAPPCGTRVVGARMLQQMPSDRPCVPRIGADLAYVLYTSGSTGEPKGVMLSHENALAFVEWAAQEFALCPDDRVSSHAPLHFDLSIFDLFATGFAGASVSLVPAAASVFPLQIASFMDTKRISVWYSVPSVLRMLMSRGGLAPDSLPSLRTVLFAGEVFPTKHLRSLMQLLPHASFYNLYGPTETNVCTFHRVALPADDAVAPIPIGRAIENTEVFAMTDGGAVADVGEEGELLVRGSTVMKGYWRDEDQTSHVLVPDPRMTGDLVYRTGDIVRQRPDGDYDFLGRRDSQVKSRGYRIELGEIETALYAHPGVLECAAVAVPDDVVGTRIDAIVVAVSGVTSAQLAEHCLRLLPRYMVPQLVHLTSELPRTSTGKVDRVGLARSR